jgi:branched-chain amino acid transport system ATP-binding protein
MTHADMILESKGLTRQFNGFTAVNGIDLRVRRGTIHALIGPNGAGKTTCFNLLTKFLTPTSGHIFFDGREITRAEPAAIARRGVIRSFQISAVFPHLTPVENVAIALQRPLGVSFSFWKSDAVLERLRERALELLDEVGLGAYADVKTVELGMGHEDVDRVTALIRKVSDGRTILMVEHNMKMVSSIADTITVLQRGEILADGDYASVSANPLVKEAYMGTEDESLAH